MPWSWERPPPVIGHRGSPREAPENTLESFEAALRAGAGAVELDARLSADGVVVVHHDRDLGRVLAGEGLVEEKTADELRALGVPLLSEALALGAPLDIEMKADAENAAALPERVLDEVRRADALDRALVTSFDHELASEYARLAGRPAGMIVPYPPDDALASHPLLAIVALAEDAALPEVIDACRREGRVVLVWTVNDVAAAQALWRAGAAGIITDRPGPMARGRR